ncbi:MAG: hypothetical protein K2X27_04990 [Candidatus Obscuribacterales bacterium]|nr:hypothetical protein [Candidatus Obscuribacterales bacterium]
MARVPVKALVSIICYTLLILQKDALAYDYDEIIRISQAEQKVFGRVNTNQSLDERVTALENSLFGSANKGPEAERVSKICWKTGIPCPVPPKASSPEPAVKTAEELKQPAPRKKTQLLKAKEKNEARKTSRKQENEIKTGESPEQERPISKSAQLRSEKIEPGKSKEESAALIPEKKVESHNSQSRSLAKESSGAPISSVENLSSAIDANKADTKSNEARSQIQNETEESPAAKNPEPSIAEPDNAKPESILKEEPAISPSKVLPGPLPPGQVSTKLENPLQFTLLVMLALIPAVGFGFFFLYRFGILNKNVKNKKEDD